MFHRATYLQIGKATYFCGAKRIWVKVCNNIRWPHGMAAFMGFIAACVCSSSLLASEIIAPNSAVAKLNHAGFKSKSHCTGFITEEDVVLTAAHCLPKIRKDAVHILLGYDSGEVTQHLKVPARSYEIRSDRDVAALCHHTRLGSSNDLGQRFRLSKKTSEPGTQVTIQGYGSPKEHVLQENTCAIKQVLDDGYIVLDCALPSGTSGAPVIDVETGLVQGIVSASSQELTLVSSINRDFVKNLCPLDAKK